MPRPSAAEPGIDLALAPSNHSRSHAVQPLPNSRGGMTGKKTPVANASPASPFDPGGIQVPVVAPRSPMQQRRFSRVPGVAVFSNSSASGTPLGGQRLGMDQLSSSPPEAFSQARATVARNTFKTTTMGSPGRPKSVTNRRLASAEELVLSPDSAPPRIPQQMRRQSFTDATRIQGLDEDRPMTEPSYRASRFLPGFSPGARTSPSDSKFQSRLDLSNVKPVDLADRLSGSKPATLQVEVSQPSQSSLMDSPFQRAGKPLPDRRTLLVNESTQNSNNNFSLEPDGDGGDEPKAEALREVVSPSRKMQSFQQAQEHALKAAELQESLPYDQRDRSENEEPGENATWGIAVGDLRRESKVVPLELTEAKREDLLHHLSCARETGYLNLTFHQWPELPPEVAEFMAKQGHYLKALNMEGNQTRIIPDAFHSMRVLVSLNLSGNQLTELPGSLQQLHSLKSLSLEKNCLRNLPEHLGQCTSLTYLDLSHNNVMVLPDSFRNLRNLFTLKVSHNRLCHLPEQICAMTSLREINASHNVITGIPSELGSLTKLQLLLLDHNKLTALPDTVGGLWRTLTELTLNHNRLTVLPNSLGACKKITILDLGSNPLVSPLPDVCRLGPQHVLTYLSSGSTLGHTELHSGLKTPRLLNRSRKRLLDMVSLVSKELQPNKEVTGAEPGTECGLCMKLHKEILEWKAEVQDLADALADKDEELEEMRRDNVELRENMMRKQKLLREVEKGLQTLIHERNEAIKQTESLQAEVGGLVNSGSHAASELYELRVTVEELKKENKRLEEVGDRRNQELVCAKDDLSMAKSSKDEMSKLLDEIRGQAAAESALASQAESRRKSESEAAARREAELKSQVYHLEKALERLSTGSKHVLKKAGEVHLNFDPSPGKS